VTGVEGFVGEAWLEAEEDRRVSPTLLLSSELEEEGSIDELKDSGDFRLFLSLSREMLTNG
jgi:hypothetical protein